MSTITKTPEQIEVAEIFARLEADYGMTKADVARALNIERGYVGMLVKGERSPSPRTLADFRKLEAQKKQAKAGDEKGGEASELEQIFDRIAQLERHDRDKFETVKRMVEILTPPNSTATSARKRLLNKAAASVRKPVRE